MTLGCRIVNFLRLYLLNDTNEVGCVRKVAVMQMQAHTALVQILAQTTDTVRIE